MEIRINSSQCTSSALSNTSRHISVSQNYTLSQVQQISTRRHSYIFINITITESSAREINVASSGRQPVHVSLLSVEHARHAGVNHNQHQPTARTWRVIADGPTVTDCRDDRTCDQLSTTPALKPRLHVHRRLITVRLRSIVMSMSACLFVCLSVRSHNSKTTLPNFTKFLCTMPVAVASVLLWRHCDMLCSSGFTDDVVFSYRGAKGPSRKGVPVVW